MNYLAQVNIGQEFFQNFVGPHTSAGTFGSLTAIGSLVSLFLNIAYVIAGIILLFYFLIGGISMMSSAGQNDPQKLAQAKKTLLSALIGLIIVFASYFIVQFITSLFGIQGGTVFGTLFGVK